MENRVGKHDGNMAFLSVPAAVSSLLTADSMHIIIYLLLSKQSAWQEGVVKWSLGWSSEIHTDYETHTSPPGSSQRILQCGATLSPNDDSNKCTAAAAQSLLQRHLALITPQLKAQRPLCWIKVPSNDSCFQCYPPQCCISSTDWCELALHDSAARPLFNLLMQFHFRK